MSIKINVVKYLMCAFISVCVNSSFLPVFTDMFGSFVINNILIYFGYAATPYEYILVEGFEKYVHMSRKPRFIVDGYTVKILYTKEEQFILNYLEVLDCLISVVYALELYNIVMLLSLYMDYFNPDVETIVDFLMYFW